MNHQELIRESAVELFEHGLLPVKVPLGTKAPKTKGWQTKRYSSSNDVDADFAKDSNLGVILGEQSNGSWLTDLDLDTEEARYVALEFLGRLSVIGAHTREGIPTHYWFKTDEELVTKKYIDVDGTMICELRGPGLQTIIPPSTHPSGETLTWSPGFWGIKNLPEIHRTLARNFANSIAAAALLVRHWPVEGSRQYLTLALTGFLLHSGWSVADVGLFVSIVLTQSGDHTKERRTAVSSTMTQFEKSGKVTGGPTMASILGQQVYDKFIDFLGLPEPAQIELEDEDDEVQIPNRLVSVGELRKAKIVTTGEVVEGLIWAGKTHWLYSDPNVGKTMFALALAMHVASGREFAGRMVRQGPVAIIEEDSSLAVIFDYLDNFDDIYDLNSDLLPIHINPNQGIRLVSAKGKDKILDLIDSAPTQPSLVIFDSCERILPSSSFTSREVDPLDQLLKTLANRGIANLVLDHTTKSLVDHPHDMDVLYGSRAKSAIADIMIQLGGSIKSGAMTASFTKFRGDTPPDIDIYYKSDIGFKLQDRPGRVASDYERDLYGWFLLQPREWISTMSAGVGFFEDQELENNDKQLQRLRRSLNAMSSRRLLRHKTNELGVDEYHLNS